MEARYLASTSEGRSDSLGWCCQSRYAPDELRDHFVSAACSRDKTEPVCPRHDALGRKRPEAVRHVYRLKRVERVCCGLAVLDLPVNQILQSHA
jgi:hypothetical protein